MGAITSRQNAGVEEVDIGVNHAYRYPPKSGKIYGRECRSWVLSRRKPKGVIFSQGVFPLLFLLRFLGGYVFIYLICCCSVVTVSYVFVYVFLFPFVIVWVFVIILCVIFSALYIFWISIMYLFLFLLSLEGVASAHSLYLWRIPFARFTLWPSWQRGSKN